MSRQELVKMIPEFDLIKDEDLRGKAVTVFEKAMEEGGWTATDLEDIPFTLLLEGCDISLITHTRAIAKISSYAADLFEELYPGRLKLNRDYLIAGAILHDVGKLVEYRKEGGKVVKSRTGMLHRHPFTGAAIAREAGLPSEVIHMIYAHAKEGDLANRIPEAAIIHHADFMSFEPLKSVFKHS